MMIYANIYISKNALVDTEAVAKQQVSLLCQAAFEFEHLQSCHIF